MAYYFRQRVSAELYLDSDTKSIKHKLDLDAECTAVSSDYDARQAGTIYVPIGGTVVVPMSLVSIVKGYYVRGLGAFTLYRNGGVEPEEFTPVDTTAVSGGNAWAVAHCNSRVTALSVLNQTVAVLKVEYEIWGNQA